MDSNYLVDFDQNKRRWQINTELRVEFSILYSTDIFSINNHDLANIGDSDRKILVVDKVVYLLYEKSIHNYFNSLKLKFELLVIEVNEELKVWNSADEVLSFFESLKILRRSEPVIVVGGGVLLDLVGFCCSIYRRGIPYVKVPTTLLALVDASVGAKVAINHMGRRNRLGAYYPAILTLLDKKFIKTQDSRAITNGIAEIYKLALIKNYELFQLLEENYSILINEKFQHGAVSVRAINLAISGMIEELSPNLWEKRLDRCVDFGHSFSPLIEMNNLPELLHGEAVVLDCLFSSCISFFREYIKKDDLIRIFRTAKNLGLPIFHSDFINSEKLIDALDDSVKHRNQNQHLPLPIEIGNYVIVNDLSKAEILGAIEVFQEMKNANY